MMNIDVGNIVIEWNVLCIGDGKVRRVELENEGGMNIWRFEGIW